MGHSIKGQSPGKYRPSVGRRNSGLSPVKEISEKPTEYWNKLRQAVRRKSLNKSRQTVMKGRFLVGPASPKKASPRKTRPLANVPPGKYGRFSVRVVPPKRNARQNLINKHRTVEDKIYKLEELISDMRRKFAAKLYPLEDQLEEYHAQSKNLKKRINSGH